MPKVSICIPTYNNLDAFTRCFKSILSQSYTDYEVVITDDSTNEDIRSFISEYSSENIHYYKNKKQLGSPENWNESIRKAKGKFIKILHHDDWFTYEGSLEIFVQLLEKNPESSLAFVASKNIDLENNKVINYNRPSKQKIEQIKNNPITLLNGNFIGAPSATIFRNNNSISFDTKTIWYVDIDFYIQILSKNNELIYCDIDAISIGGSSTQITKNVENDKKINIFEHFYLLNKWNIKKIIGSEIEKNTFFHLTKFRIKNKKDIRISGYTDLLPSDIDKIFNKIFLVNIKEKIQSKIRKMFHLFTFPKI